MLVRDVRCVCVFVCAGCLHVKEKIPCAILVFTIMSDVYI